MQNKNEYTIKEALELLLKQYQLNEKLDETKIAAAWENMMGKTIARHTQKLFVRNRKLYLAIDIPALKNELLFSKYKIIQILNKQLSSEVIDDVVFL